MFENIHCHYSQSVCRPKVNLTVSESHLNFEQHSLPAKENSSISALITKEN